MVSLNDFSIYYSEAHIVLSHFYSSRTDITSNGTVIETDRPSGAHAEHRQPSKTINAKAQQRKRAELRRKKLAEAHRDAVVERDAISEILSRNHDVEVELQAKTNIATVADAGVVDFLPLSVAKLQDFIHARKFNGKTFHKSKLAGTDGKLNKLRYSKQTAESVENDCSDEEPCLVWLAWKHRADPVILEERPVPVMNTSIQAPEFTVTSATREDTKLPSDYLNDEQWVGVLKSVVKGVEAVPIDEALLSKADALALALDQRLDLHIASDRVDDSRRNHWTMRFTRDNIPPMSAAMCIVGHVVEDIPLYRIDECLLCLPMTELFHIVTGDLSKLEGCYLFFDPNKYKWIRSGKSSGDGKDACFEGRGKKHVENSKSKDQMRAHRLYREYPWSKDIQSIGEPEGFFENLVMYCGMAYDKRSDVKALCSNGAPDSLFVWSEESIRELKKKSGHLQKLQLDAIAYLWELCYDLVLATSNNVSTSPGFEAFGLRVDNRKRKRSED